MRILRERFKADVRPYGKALQALTPYGPGSFTEEAYVSFMASAKPCERS